jgi:AcrR family transcriptional regulator
MSVSRLDSAIPLENSHRRRTQAERREESETRLIEAAMHIVAERGVERMTLADVGEMAGYSRGLAAHHFGTKGGLLRILVESVANSFKKNLSAGPKRRAGMDALHGFLDQYFASIAVMNDYSRAFLVLMIDSSLVGSEVEDSIVKFNQESIGFLTAQLRIAKLKGEILEDIPLESAAVLIVGLMRGIMLQQLSDRSSFDLKSLQAYTLLAIHRLLGIKEID